MEKAIQRSATTECSDGQVPPTEGSPEVRRSFSMDTGEAEGVRKALSGYSGSFKRRSIRVSE